MIDREHCTYFKNGKCGVCQKLCGPQAVDFEQEDELVTEAVGAVVLATGYSALRHRRARRTGLRGYPGVRRRQAARTSSTGCSSSGWPPPPGRPAARSAGPPTARSRRRSSSCSASAAAITSKGIEYCSKICCMYTAKHAMLYKHKVHDGQAIVFYMDVRAPGKGYDEFVRRAVEEDEVLYLRGRVSRLYEDKGQIVVSGVGHPAGRDGGDPRRPGRPGHGHPLAAGRASRLAQLFGVGYDGHGFYSEAHPKLRPVESRRRGRLPRRRVPGAEGHPGVGGAGQRRRGQGRWSSSRKEILEREPIVARVQRGHLRRLLRLQGGLPLRRGRGASRSATGRGRLLRRVARVNAGVCNGCGTCQATCPSKSVELDGYTDEQIFAQIGALDAVREARGHRR